MSEAALASAAGMTQPKISRVLGGARQLTCEDADTLRETLGLELAELLRLGDVALAGASVPSASESVLDVLRRGVKGLDPVALAMLWEIADRQRAGFEEIARKIEHLESAKR